MEKIAQESILFPKKCVSRRAFHILFNFVSLSPLFPQKSARNCWEHHFLFQTPSNNLNAKHQRDPKNHNLICNFGQQKPVNKMLNGNSIESLKFDFAKKKQIGI